VVALLRQSPLMSAEGQAAPPEKHREAQKCLLLNPEPCLHLNMSLFTSLGQGGSWQEERGGEGWVAGSCQLPLHRVIANGSGNFPPC